MSSGDGRRGITTGDVLIVLAFLSIGVALALPTLRAREFRGAVQATVADVGSLRTAAEQHLSRTGQWPDSAEPGAVPTELTSDLTDPDLSRERYSLQWTRWAVVDSTEAPPDPGPATIDAPPDSVGPVMMPIVREVGAIVLHSGDADLIAELMATFGSSSSFVRDTTWTLVLPERSSGS